MAVSISRRVLLLRTLILLQPEHNPDAPPHLWWCDLHLFGKATLRTVCPKIFPPCLNRPYIKYLDDVTGMTTLQQYCHCVHNSAPQPDLPSQLPVRAAVAPTENLDVLELCIHPPRSIWDLCLGFDHDLDERDPAHPRFEQGPQSSQLSYEAKGHAGRSGNVVVSGGGPSGTLVPFGVNLDPAPI